jgi:hypothetical protein
MHTRNTTTTTQRVSMGKALFVLELLAHEDTQLVLDFFGEYPCGSYLDLLVSTQLDAERLEYLLGRLLETNVLLEKDSVYGTEYEPNFDRLRVIAKGTKKLSHGIAKQPALVR